MAEVLRQVSTAARSPWSPAAAPASAGPPRSSSPARRRVVICGRRQEPLETTAAEIEAPAAHVPHGAGRHPRAGPGRAGWSTRARALRPVDVLVNNAGGQFPAPAEEITARLARGAPAASTRYGRDPRGGDALDDPEPARRPLLPRFTPRRGIRVVHALGARARGREPRRRAGARVEPLRHPLPLRRARHDRHRGPCRGYPTTTRPLGSARCRSAGSAPPRRSPGVIAFSPLRSAPTSPARPSPSTAASTPGAPEDPHPARDRH